VARVRPASDDGLAEICKVPNEGPDCAMMPRDHSKRATRLCIQWLWRVVPMSLRGCRILTNEKPRFHHAQQNCELHSNCQSLVMGRGQGRCRKWILYRTLGGSCEG
jgi:hypothetical protein